jgi:hypothetical protein
LKINKANDPGAQHATRATPQTAPPLNDLTVAARAALKQFQRRRLQDQFSYVILRAQNVDQS